MSKMTVLVTGGAGYIGSHTAKRLAEAGHRVVVYDNLSRGHRHAVRWGPLVEGELTDREKLRHTLIREQIDVVIHFAALAYVGESMLAPEAYFQNNVAGTVCLLEAMRRCQVSKIVFSSTCATYGEPLRLPLDETHPQLPINPYGESKLMVEKILWWMGERTALDWIALRYFNAAGADPNGELGEEHDPETHLIPCALRAALGGERLQVFGDDYPTPDGSAVRDYIHVSDLAQAHLLALDALCLGSIRRQAFNLGTGAGTSVREVIAAVEHVTGQPVPHDIQPRRPGDPPVLVADPALAMAHLGWQPRYSDLATICRTAGDWMRKKMASQSRT